MGTWQRRQLDSGVNKGLSWLIRAGDGIGTIMNMPLTREGWKELLVLTALCVGAAWAAVTWFWPAAVVVAAVWMWGVSFFRDPRRIVPGEPDVLVAPADGKVVAIEPVEQSEWTAAPAVRIAIFLSIVDVHINRSPCAGMVKKVVGRAGRYLNALRAEAGVQNASNNVVLSPEGGLPGPVVVRQIAGVLARRIVCHARPGDRLETGQRFGMIKFGSRTELYLPADAGWQVLVAPGQKVRAGSTILCRYVPTNTGRLKEDGVETAAETFG